jgi:DNA-directed RNA polymerase subunit M/transcription elongation factor TFIIS
LDKYIVANKLDFGNCPRCRGFLFVDRDTYGSYVQCVNCSYTKDLPNTLQPELQLVSNKGLK